MACFWHSTSNKLPEFLSIPLLLQLKIDYSYTWILTYVIWKALIIMILERNEFVAKI